MNNTVNENFERAVKDTEPDELDKIIARIRLKKGTSGFISVPGLTLVGITDAEAKQAILNLINEARIDKAT
jgi:hypothetical protein